MLLNLVSGTFLNKLQFFIIWINSCFRVLYESCFASGLDILKDMITQFANYPDTAKAQAFYKVFFMEILIHVLSVVADRNQIKIAGLFFVSHNVQCLG